MSIACVDGMKEDAIRSRFGRMFVLPQVTVLDYMQKIAVSNFRKSWEDINEEAEQTDVYGLGARNSLQEAVEAVMDILGMQPWCVQSLQSSIATLYH